VLTELAELVARFEWLRAELRRVLDEAERD
jgi:hypothetical protein